MISHACASAAGSAAAARTSRPRRPDPTTAFHGKGATAVCEGDSTAADMGSTLIAAADIAAADRWGSAGIHRRGLPPPADRRVGWIRRRCGWGGRGGPAVRPPRGAGGRTGRRAVRPRFGAAGAGGPARVRVRRVGMPRPRARARRALRQARWRRGRGSVRFGGGEGEEGGANASWKLGLLCFEAVERFVVGVEARPRGCRVESSRTVRSAGVRRWPTARVRGRRRGRGRVRHPGRRRRSRGSGPG